LLAARARAKEKHDFQTDMAPYYKFLKVDPPTVGTDGSDEDEAASAAAGWTTEDENKWNEQRRKEATKRAQDIAALGDTSSAESMWDHEDLDCKPKAQQKPKASPRSPEASSESPESVDSDWSKPIMNLLNKKKRKQEPN